MENILFKQITKRTLMLISPLIVLSLALFDGQPKVAVAIVIGALLGLLRLTAFFSYITYTIDREKSNKAVIALIKYIASWLFTLGVIGFILVKSITIGLAMLFGLITVPITITVFATLKGISFYRKK